MKYRIEIKSSVEKSLRKMPAKAVRTIRDKIRALADDPRPNGCKKLKDSDDIYRIRTGNYRILYTVEDKVLTITVIRVGNRKYVY